MSYDSNNNGPTPPFRGSDRGDSGGDRGPQRPQRNFRGVLIWILIIGLVVLLVSSYQDFGAGNVSENGSRLQKLVMNSPEAIESARIEGDYVYATLRSGHYAEGEAGSFKVYVGDNDELETEWHNRLSELGDEVYTGRKPAPFDWKSLALAMLPWLVLGGLIYFFFFRQIRQSGMGGGMMSFGKTRARLVRRESSKVTFEDVAGMVEAKDEVTEIIDFLRDPKKFQRIGARIPRGVLFIGPPGTGKTLLAKAIAGEADVPFFSISGSDFVEMFVGVGASRVRDLFRQAKENSPCIIFLDEIDAVGRRRGTGFSGAHDEREQTLNAILVEMDGFDTSDQVITIAATNRPDVLDPALRRPGRFDRQVIIELPDIKERKAILKVHAARVKMAPGIDLSVIARGTPGFSGADLASLVNEAALLAIMEEREQVEAADLEEARDKVRWGRSRRSRVMDEMDKRVSAYHEAGHALLSVLLQPHVEPLHKVTIIPRGPSLGSTMFLPQKDRHLVRQRECMGNMMVSFGGRISEELVFEDISSGAAADIKGATSLARRMVTEWGMSTAVGPIDYTSGDEDSGGMMPPGMFGSRTHSEHTAAEIDEEVRRIIDEAYKQARELLVENRDKLDLLAEALLAYEVVDAAEVEQILEGKQLQRAQKAPAEEQPEAEKSSAEPETQGRPDTPPEILPGEGPEPAPGA